MKSDFRMPQINSYDDRNIMFIDKDYVNINLMVNINGEPLSDMLNFIIDPSTTTNSNRLQDLNAIMQLTAYYWATKFFLHKCITTLPLLDVANSNFMDVVMKQQRDMYRLTGNIGITVPDLMIIPTGPIRKPLEETISQNLAKGKRSILDAFTYDPKENVYIRKATGQPNKPNYQPEMKLTEEDFENLRDQLASAKDTITTKSKIIQNIVSIGIRSIIPRLFATNDTWGEAISYLNSIIKPHSTIKSPIKIFMTFIKTINRTIRNHVRDFSRTLDNTFSKNIRHFFDTGGDAFASRRNILFQKTISSLFEAHTSHTMIYIDDDVIDKNPKLIDTFLELSSRISLSKIHEVLGKYSNIVLASKKRDLVIIICDRLLLRTPQIDSSNPRVNDTYNYRIIHAIDSLTNNTLSESDREKYKNQVSVMDGVAKNHGFTNFVYSNYGFTMTYTDAMALYRLRVDSQDDYTKLIENFSTKVRPIDNTRDIIRSIRFMFNDRK